MMNSREAATPPDAQYVLDPTYPHRPRHISAEVLALTGFAPTEFLVNHTLFVSRLHPDDMGRVFALYNDAVGRGEGTADYRFMHRDGHYRWFRAVARLVRDEHGTPLEIHTRSSDITDSRRREAALLGREEYFRRLIDHASDVIIVLALDGTIQYESPAIRQLAGYRPEELIGQNGFDFIHPDDVHEVQRQFQLALRSIPGLRPAEFRHRHADGGWRVVEAVASPLIEHGRLAGGIVNARDITDRRRLEEQLTHVRKMEAVGRLAGGVAHDFNNLLTAILGYSELMSRELPEDSPLHDDLREIREAGEAAAELTRQLLAFGRKQILEPAVLDLNRSVEGGARMLHRLLGERTVLQLSLGEGLRPILADGNQIEHVLMTLAANARDAMPDGGPLVVRTERIVLHRHLMLRDLRVPPGSYSVLHVEDAGIGMTREALDHLFEPFYSTKPRARGAGLGMAAVYGIVSQSGGHVLVDSAPGRGTVVSIYFPEVQDVDVSIAADAPAVAPRPLTILLVEDNDMLRSFARRVLTAEGHVVLAASKADDALRQLTSHEGPLDLLLTDVVMPGTSGIALAERLVRERPGLRCVYTSGYTDDALRREGLVRREMPFLPKPFTAQRLLQVVQDVMQRPATPAPSETRQSNA